MNQTIRSEADDAAAYWDARLRSPECTPDDRSAFTAWHEASPEHAAAYARMQAVLGAIHSAYATSPELRAMRDRALKTRPRFDWRIAAAIGAIMLVAAAGFGIWRGARPIQTAQAQHTPSIYQTAVGERTVVQLSDGSKVTLNTRSRMEVIYTAKRRAVTLTAGQGLFQVAKDASRPFVVTAGRRQVTAVGTEFDVRLDSAQMSVSMVEGRVRVEPTASRNSSEEQNLVAGQRLTDTGSGAVRVTMVEPAEVLNWTQGRVVFEDTPLIDAIGELNRYSATPIVLSDPSLQRLRINGTFRTEQPVSFLRALAAYLPVDLQQTATAITIVPRRSSTR